MHRPQLVIGPTALAAVLSGALAVVADPGPIEPSSSLLIAFGLVVAGVTAMSGLMLARAPWGRWSLAGIVTAAMAISAVGETALTWSTLILGGLALVGLLGPWLTLWTRHHRLTDAPGPVVVALEAIAAGAPLFVGLATVRSGASWYHWALTLLTMAASVLYGRGTVAGRWLLRTAVPATAIAVGWATGAIAGSALALAGATIGIVAWTPASRRATTVIAPVLPTPVARGGEQ